MRPDDPGAGRAGAPPDPAAEAARRATYAYTGAFFAALAAAGIRHVCVSPGSRSAPLAVAAARTPGIAVVPILDERSAGFFALGLARQSARPVALVCTSGTAATNYLPAVTEAHYARVPLVVLTADRPPELREWGAGQTIDQQGLYGRAVKAYVEVPIPTPSPTPAGEGPLLRHARALASRAVGDALAAPAGPVHLDWPLREPLDPPAGGAPEAGDAETGASAGDEATRLARSPAVHVTRAVATPAEADVADLARALGGGRRGVIACGPMPPSPERDRALCALAERAGWPILADPASGLRRGPHTEGAPIVAHADLWLRDAELARRHAPEVVLRFGDTPTSKAFRLWLETAPPEELVLVDEAGGWADPSHLATRVVRGDATVLACALAERMPAADAPSRWCASFVGADRRAGEALAKAIASGGPALDEAVAVQALGARLPADATLYVSSSMPIRDVDAFLPVATRPLRVLANRGANGIDGVTSSALGAAFAGRGPVVLVTGDLALLHDLGGLLTARTAGIPLVVVVLNNDGGGIFSFLPIAAHGEAVDFERLFLTPHGVDFAHAAALFGLGYTKVGGPAEYGETLDRLLAAPPARTHVVELPTDREANVARFRALAGVAARAAAAGDGP